MKAIVVKSENKEPRFVWEEVPDIKPEPDEVLVDIKATAVNRADLLQARGLYPPPPGESEILGLEMAGVVSAMGDQAKGRKIGDRVAGRRRVCPAGRHSSRNAPSTAGQLVVFSGSCYPGSLADGF